MDPIVVLIGIVAVLFVAFVVFFVRFNAAFDATIDDMHERVLDLRLGYLKLSLAYEEANRAQIELRIKELEARTTKD